MSENKDMAVATTDVTKAPKKEGFGYIVWPLLFVAACAIGVWFFLKGSPSQISMVAIDKFAIMDSGAVISAATEKFLSQAKEDGSSASQRGKEFSMQLEQVLSAYKERGVIVFDKRYVVTAPDGHDITGDVAAQLGLSLSE